MPQPPKIFRVWIWRERTSLEDLYYRHPALLRIMLRAVCLLLGHEPARWTRHYWKRHGQFFRSDATIWRCERCHSWLLADYHHHPTDSPT